LTGPPVLTRLVGAVLEVTLNRPGRLNAVDGAMLDALSDAWSRSREDDVRAVVLTGAGKGFCAGGDIIASADVPVAPLLRRHNANLLAMAELAKPVISAVNGTAAGSGISLACAADICLASDRARFVPAFLQHGYVPDVGATYFLPRRIGEQRTMVWLSTGRRLSAPEAHQWGLVAEVVEHLRLMERAWELATTFADLPPKAVAMTKGLLAASWRSSLAEQLDREVAAQEGVSGAPETLAARSAAREAIRAR